MAASGSGGGGSSILTPQQQQQMSMPHQQVLTPADRVMLNLSAHGIHKDGLGSVYIGKLTPDQLFSLSLAVPALLETDVLRPAPAPGEPGELMDCLAVM